jgi:DNA-binding response OmpR family regulator
LVLLAAGRNLATGTFVPSSNDCPPPRVRSSEDLTGLNILLVEDSPDVGEAVKKLLELLGATVAGPAPTMAAAESLLAERLPDVALLDFHLRGGERSDGLIARMRQQGVPVIMLSGSFEFPPLQSLAGATIVEKPVSEAELLAHLSPLAIKIRTQ